MEDNALHDAADLLWRTRLQQERIDALPEQLRPATLAEGYAIQDAMVALARQPVTGWKIAATSKAGQAHIGVTEPLAGRLFADFVLKSGAELPGAKLHMKVVEAEFAFRMGRALPPRPEPYSQAQVCGAVDALHLAIEVPDARYDDFANVGAPQIAADDAFASWFLLGPRISHWTDLDLAQQKVRVLRNGNVAEEGSGANALGDPRIALTWLANHLAKRGIGLKEGDVVTTGTCITPALLQPGDRFVADFAGLGQVSVAFS